MGILYNRFTSEPSSTAWTLIKTFTEVNTDVTLPDLTGKTELLVVCDDRISLLFCLWDIRSSNHHNDGASGEKIYNTNTGTGYRYEVNFYHYYPAYQAPFIRVYGIEILSLSQLQDLSSVNTKVYVR